MTGSAVYYTDIASFADNLVFLCQTNSVTYLIAEVITDWLAENEDYGDLPLSTEDVNSILKALTGMTVATNTDLNCYPRGLESQILFDLAGDEVT